VDDDVRAEEPTPVGLYLRRVGTRTGKDRFASRELRDPQSPYAAVSVLAVAPDVGQHVLAGETIIIERSMLNEVTFEGETFYLVLENYILGVIEREP